MTHILERLAQVIESRKLADPEKSYVAKLYQRGPDAILKKIGEEATEVIMAAKDVHYGADVKQLVNEVADLWFHSLLILSYCHASPAEVFKVLEQREGLSGIAEKAARKEIARSESARPEAPSQALVQEVVHQGAELAVQREASQQEAVSQEGKTHG